MVVREIGGHTFNSINVVDTEFCAPEGENPSVVCLVIKELISGKVHRYWHDELGPEPPFRIDDSALLVAFMADAETSCFIQLGWPTPKNIFDQHAEFRAITNGLRPPQGKMNGLLAALAYYGLPAIDPEEKDYWRNIVMHGPPWTEEEKAGILEYCEGDVNESAALFEYMLRDTRQFSHALFRGRYTGGAVARMRAYGVPIDTEVQGKLVRHWAKIKANLISAVDVKYNVYRKTSFNLERFEEYLKENNIPWIRTPTGRLSTAEEVFRDAAKRFPQLSDLHELRVTVDSMKLNKISVGADGRNRVLLGQFGSVTGRNQPSNTQFVFGPATWVRGLIKPAEGRGLAYLDWRAQEFAIAAALSGDQTMIADYRSGDPYIRLAAHAGAVPSDATKATHPAAREIYKTACLALQYGQGAFGLAPRLGISQAAAKSIIAAHQERYPVFWKWSACIVNHTMLNRRLHTALQWPIRYGPKVEINARSVMNFPMQGNGADMMRVACCLATEAGIQVCCPIHDAVLIESPLDRLEADAEAMMVIMRRAARAVLRGFEVDADAKYVHYPDRYMDPRGAGMWETIIKLLEGYGA
jgi:DNA polymerase I